MPDSAAELEKVGDPPMSADASAGAPFPSADEKQEEYEELLEILDVGIEQAVYKIDGDGRISDPDRERARAKWCNTLAKLVKERRMVLRDRDLVELTEVAERIEEQGGL